jgi:hypothetical protein
MAAAGARSAGSGSIGTAEPGGGDAGRRSGSSPLPPVGARAPHESRYRGIPHVCVPSSCHLRDDCPGVAPRRGVFPSCERAGTPFARGGQDASSRARTCVPGAGEASAPASRCPGRLGARRRLRGARRARRLRGGFRSSCNRRAAAPSAAASFRRVVGRAGPLSAQPRPAHRGRRQEHARSRRRLPRRLAGARTRGRRRSLCRAPGRCRGCGRLQNRLGRRRQSRRDGCDGRGRKRLASR